ncbi:Hemolysin-type calcium-binding protein [Rhodoferax ferrireducens T118]|uniref:Hemolysin-type calcium-binding protein n=1 Tax=Albidiferax ferrireducens (strain ATCC BAA-621 / DSM 15236 / T118) TaxID=338969 RepID=Q21RY7_ALBFT|nr:retention module-containing protein [Rhodoferax ferrireducens]ABD71466.1 Hemolysin-type calcium-binding protein [Rhodoferax ferrireducens T118]
MAQFATVAAITGNGTVYAVNAQGISRTLKAGDNLENGETVRTIGDARVEFVMEDGRLLAVAPEQTVRLDENVIESDQRPTAQDSAIVTLGATADTVIQALERGTDLSTELEATAAGLGVGGGADGGSTFVQLLRVTEGVDSQSYDFSFTASDVPSNLPVQADIAPATLSAVNDAPSITVVAQDFTENAAKTGAVAATYATADEEGDTLKVDFSAGSNAAGYYALAGGQVVLTAAGAAQVNAGGALPAIELTVSDATLSGTGSDTPVVTLVNDAPSITVVAQDFTENAAKTGAVAATYATADEEGDTLKVDFSAGSNAAGYYALAGGQVVLTAAGAAQVNAGGALPAIELTVSDATLSGTGSDTPVVTLVNDAPSITVVAQDFTENAAKTGAVAATYATADEEGDTLKVDFSAGSNAAGYYALAGGQVVLTAAGAAQVNAGGALPAIELTVSDATLSGTGSDTPVVTLVNDAPSITVVAQDFTENAAKTGAVAATYATADEEGDTLKVDFSAGSNAAGYYALAGGQVVLTAAGAAQVNAGGALPAIELTVSDATLSGTGSDTPVVTLVNDAPIGNADAYSTIEGSISTTLGNVLANDQDIDSPSITVAQFASSASASNTVVSANGSNMITTALGGIVVMNSDGAFRYIAPVVQHDSENTPVSDSFVYRSTDGSAVSDWTTVTVSLGDTSPIASADNATVVFNGLLTGNLLVNDSGVDGPLSVTSVTYNGTTNTIAAGGHTSFVTPDGRLMVNSDGAYIFYSSIPQTKVITGSSLATWEDSTDLYGFNQSSTAWRQNVSGSTTTLNIGALTTTQQDLAAYVNSGAKPGIGVQGQGSTLGSGEQLIVKLLETTTSATVGIAQLNAGQSPSLAKWEAYDASGNHLAGGTFDGATATSSGSEYALQIDSETPFTYLRIEWTGNSQGIVLSSLDTLRTTDNHTQTFSYTMSDADGDFSSSTLAVASAASGSTPNASFDGTSGNDSHSGTTGNDTMQGNAGDDVLYGHAGDDKLNGGDGNDMLSGGDGNDLLIGGAGHDVLIGGLGSDTFKWSFGDQGTAASPAADHIMDFTPGVGGDVLDLKDLLVGEHDGSGVSGNLAQFLHFANDASGKAVLSIDHNGTSDGAAFAADQTIKFDNMSMSELATGLGLTGGATSDDIVAKMLVNGQLKTDV